MAMVAGLVGRFRGKALKFMAVSVLSTMVSLTLIAIFHSGLHWGGVASNVAAVCLSSIPSFLLNKRWVWGNDAAHSWSREVVPFWSMALAGLVLSTLLVAVAEHWSTSTLTVSAANLAGFGVLWVAKFLILDEYLFSSEEPRGADDGIARS
jgi:putative flippase GtrA